ncbi:MAG: ParB N-terminal domain-containing protein [Candidatus Accumulibacter similis]|nr:MAG: ParB N-terminal domain-containing protein [Candidatus Accumulibacter similis]
MSHYPLHPAAEIFPEMDASALAGLTADIAANGQREPILILNGQVIDGRCRLRACEQLGIEPLVRDVSAEAIDPFVLVVSLNLHRRHLTESQRATVAARKANMARGGDRPSRTDSTFDSARLQNRTEVSQAQAAGLLQVSPRSVASAAKVLQNGTPELVAAVDQGQVAVSTAAELALLPAETQREALARTPDEIRAIAREVKERITAAGVCGPSAVRIFDRVAQEQDLSGSEQCSVVEAIKADAPALPTPSEAKRIAAQGKPGLAVLATDGRYHTAPVDPQEAARLERWMRLRECLESLATVPFPPSEALTSIPPYQYRNVTEWLSRAVPFLHELHQLWSQHHA